MMNNIVQTILMQMNPQIRQQIEQTYQMAMQSGNPEQFLMQKFGNNEGFNKVLNISRNKSPEEFNNYLSNISRTMNNNR